MTCTRKKQCSYGDICPTARSDEYNLIDASCYKPLEQTNEEWLQTATTEQLAEWIAHQSIIVLLENQNNHSLRMTYPAYWVEWLKQPHTPTRSKK